MLDDDSTIIHPAVVIPQVDETTQPAEIAGVDPDIDVEPCPKPKPSKDYLNSVSGHETRTRLVEANKY
jgi:hypothetical protein